MFDWYSATSSNWLKYTYLYQNVGMAGEEMRVLSAKELIQVFLAVCLAAAFEC